MSIHILTYRHIINHRVTDSFQHAHCYRPGEKTPKNNEEKINFLLIYKKELSVVI